MRSPTSGKKAPRLIVGITGASGAIYGVRLLELLRATEIETHLIISRAGQTTLAAETNLKVADVEAARRCRAPEHRYRRRPARADRSIRLAW